MKTTFEIVDLGDTYAVSCAECSRSFFEGRFLTALDYKSDRYFIADLSRCSCKSAQPVRAIIALFPSPETAREAGLRTVQNIEAGNDLFELPLLSEKIARAYQPEWFAMPSRVLA